MRSRQMPASFGVHGPGDSTMAWGLAERTWPTLDLVVAVNHGLGAEIAQVVHEIPGEAVVVVDEDDHDFCFALIARASQVRQNAPLPRRRGTAPWPC